MATTTKQDNKISLYPLTVEEAIQGLLDTPPMPKPKAKRSRKTSDESSSEEKKPTQKKT